MNSTKKKIGVWIDGTEAKCIDPSSGIVKVIASNIENKTSHSFEAEKGTKVNEQYVHFEKKFEERKKNQTNSYLKNVIDTVSGYDQIYIFGPAEMKTHLKHSINDNKQLTKKLMDVEAADHMTDNQMVAAVKKYFEDSHHKK